MTPLSCSSLRSKPHGFWSLGVILANLGCNGNPWKCASFDIDMVSNVFHSTYRLRPSLFVPVKIDEGHLATRCTGAEGAVIAFHPRPISSETGTEYPLSHSEGWLGAETSVVTNIDLECVLSDAAGFKVYVPGSLDILRSNE